MKNCNFFPMEQIQQLVLICKNMDEKEEFIVDRYGYVFNPILYVSAVSWSKEKMNELRS